MHLQEHFFFRKFSLKFFFDSSNTIPELLVTLFIILLFGLGSQSPMGLIWLMNRVLPQFLFEFKKMERFNPEAAIAGWSIKEAVLKKLAKFTENQMCWRDSNTGVFLLIFR